MAEIQERVTDIGELFSHTFEIHVYYCRLAFMSKQNFYDYIII